MSPDPRPEDCVLVLAPSGRDAALVSSALDQAGIAHHVYASTRELREEIAKGASAAIVASEALTIAAIGELEAELASQPPWSDFPIIVFTPKAESVASNRRTLALLFRLGNVTTLERPVHALGMIGAARAALRARRRQYEARDLLAKLEDAVRQRESFLAMLGHELRNPIGAIRNAVQLADGRITRAGARERSIAIIERQSRILIRLVDDLLDVSRVTSGKVALLQEPVDLDAIARQVVEAHTPTLRAGGVELRFEQRGPRVTVDADRARLEQVLTNLLTNAAKYTPAGGRVTVAVEREGGHAIVRVEDTGIGIDADDLRRIFDPFAQSEASLERSRGGLGIGLTLARSLAELHGGTLEAASDGPGRGSTFTLRLPVLERYAPQQSHAVDWIPTVARSVLLVEDNSDNRDALRELLEWHGHRVVTAADGAEGLARAIEMQPEVALLDIGLPQLSGYELASRIRATLGDRIVLIALTGYGQPDDRRRAIESGFDAHVTKPVDIDELQHLFARLIGERTVRSG